MEGIVLSPLRIIPTAGGQVQHGLKATDETYVSFGEAYFSRVDCQAIKGWKRHNKMTLNVVVPVGAIRFVIAKETNDGIHYWETTLGPEVNYQRLTVSPGFWMAFQGIGEGLNLLMNLASIPHDPTEADTLPIENDLLVFPQG